MGIFGSRIKSSYGKPAAPIAISSPWSPQDSLVTFAVNDALAEHLKGKDLVMTREVALQNPAVNRAHGLHVTMFAESAFYQMDNAVRSAVQPRWLYTSGNGESPWHRMFGLGSDMFFNGWGCLGFTADMTDCMHVPFGMWWINPDRTVAVNEDYIPAEYRARVIAFPVGYGWGGLLNDGGRVLKQARSIEDAYMQRLDNPVPLTIMGVPRDVYESWTDDELKAYRDQWVEGRKGINGATALKIAEFPIEMPGQVPVDFFETGRNGARLDVANATSTPADLLEGAKQGGSGGTNMRYQGVGETGAMRSDLWDYGLAKRFTRAFEGRMSLDDVCPPGTSIRADRADSVSTPTPAVSNTSED